MVIMKPDNKFSLQFNHSAQHRRSARRLDGPPMPVDSALPRLMEALRDHGGAVLTAAPGAGKTTRVPLRLLDEPWLAGQRILMLGRAGPRRGVQPRTWRRCSASGPGRRSDTGSGWKAGSVRLRGSKW